MRYEDMPKGRNKDRCVRCGKRYNFADKALSKAKVPYDLLCLAEVTASGYMTHGNVKLCDECMAELLMWLDRKTENSSEKPNNCEHITEDGVTCAKYPACDDCLDNPLNKVKGSERLLKGKTEPTISKMEQVDKDINVRSKDEPQTDTHDIRTETHECVKDTHDKTEPQTEDKHAVCTGCDYYDLPNAFHPCASCVDFSKYKPKIEDEPQTEKPKIRKCIDKPFRVVWLDDDHNEIGTTQTDCSWK